MAGNPNRASSPQLRRGAQNTPVSPRLGSLTLPRRRIRGHCRTMTAEQATTMTTFPHTGRPLLWRPRPWDGVLLIVLLLGLFGVPPASPVMAAGEPGTWLRPVETEVVEEFAAPPAPWAPGHRGIDLTVPTGQEIRSPADGVVSFSGVVVNREVLSIDHGAGYVSSFEPVESDLEVGNPVSTGDVVARLDTYDDGSHHCTAKSATAQPCLHWGVRLHGDYINPLLMLGDLEPSVLLPLEGGG